MAGYPETPHLAWPVRLDGDHLAVVEQDTLADVAQCVQVIYVTPRGSRDDFPELGIDDPTFSEGGVDPDELVSAAAEFEPRAVVEIDDTLDPNLLAKGQDRLAVRVRLAEEG